MVRRASNRTNENEADLAKRPASFHILRPVTLAECATGGDPPSSLRVFWGRTGAPRRQEGASPRLASSTIARTAANPARCPLSPVTCPLSPSVQKYDCDIDPPAVRPESMFIFSSKSLGLVAAALATEKSTCSAFTRSIRHWSKVCEP